MQKFFLILALVLITTSVAASVELLANQLEESNPRLDQEIVRSTPSDVYIEEYAKYERAVGNERPKQYLRGLVSWFLLAGVSIEFYLNTSDIIGEPRIWDPEAPDDPSRVEFTIYPDRITITPSSQTFMYEIEAYYDPDVIGDTGFIVIFQTQTVNFPLNFDPENGTTIYAYTDYKYTVVLPEGAGIVSYGPTDAELFKEGDRYGLKWEYRHRAMDSKHDPFVGVITYAFDPIYLQFTEIVYQNRKQQEIRQQQEQRLELQNLALVLLAIFSLIAALLAILLAYLIVKRQFKPKLEEARQLPRKTAKDVEKTRTMQRKIATFLAISIFILSSQLFMTSTLAQETIEPKDDRIIWAGVVELFKDGLSEETIQMALPLPQSRIVIWANTSQVRAFTPYDSSGAELNYEVFSDRFVVHNPGDYIMYRMTKPYEVYNNSGMLIYINRFWLEFANPNAQPDDIPYFPADITYAVVLPKGAIVYSASPSDLMKFERGEDGRKRITFRDELRQIDAFHDPFTLQVTFSFEDVLDAIENLNVEFEQFKVETLNQQELIQSTAQQLLLIALLAIITPILAFILAYWVFRKRFQRMLEEQQEKTEEELLLESPQIQILLELQKKPERQAWQAVKGVRDMLKHLLATISHQSLDRFDLDAALQELIELGYAVDIERIRETYNLLQPLVETIEHTKGTPMDEDEAARIIQDTDDLIQELWKIYRRQKS